MPTKNPLKIASICSEVAPFSKTGGLGDVARNLPKFLSKIGHEVIIITPLYDRLINKKKNGLKLIFQDVSLKLNGQETANINFWEGRTKEGLPIYFVEGKKYFSRHKRIYGLSYENVRFLIFDIAALKLLTLLEFKADIIHCHDWQTGLIPFYLKNDFYDSETLKAAKTIFTIHNLVFQFGHNWWEIPGKLRDNGKKPLPLTSDPEMERINFTKRAILHADAINTVSEQYCEEIMTKNFGQDLHRILSNRQKKLFGIINGIDYNAYNPKLDPGLPVNYDYHEIGKKNGNKEHLQKLFKLPVNAEIPLVGLTSRVTFQKGFQLIIKILERLAELDIQIIIMGDGDKKYIDQLKKYCKKFPKKLVWVPFDADRETLVYAGADIFLLPSHHEPCGINQLIAMRYGCIPVVRLVGGLYDTVENYNSKTKKGTGFVFAGFDALSLYEILVRAIEAYHDKKIWNKLMIRAMRESNSWEIPAKKYEALFKKTIKNSF